LSFSRTLEDVSRQITHLYLDGQFIDLFDAEALSILGVACARHILRGLFLGFMRSGKTPVLDPQTFIARTLYWVTMIPMENPPWIYKKDGSKVSADTILRCRPLQVLINGNLHFFHFKAGVVKAGYVYKDFCWGGASFNYAADMSLPHRNATPHEVEQLKTICHRHVAQHRQDVANDSKLDQKVEDDIVIVESTESDCTDMATFEAEIEPHNSILQAVLKRGVKVEDIQPILPELSRDEQVELLMEDNIALKKDNADVKNEVRALTARMDEKDILFQDMQKRIARVETEKQDLYDGAANQVHFLNALIAEVNIGRAQRGEAPLSQLTVPVRGRNVNNTSSFFQPADEAGDVVVIADGGAIDAQQQTTSALNLDS
jgi:hypothetical protein